MAVIIPFNSNNPHYTFQCTLDSKVYNFDVRWNTDAAFWTFDIRTIANSPILLGIKIVLGYPLIRRFFLPALPGGEIMALDTTGQLLRLGRNDLGNAVQMIYLTKADLANA